MSAAVKESIIRTELNRCPFCGGKVNAVYEGSSDWAIGHLDENGHWDNESAKCFSTVTIYSRASAAQWDADENAEWNLMASKWNSRQIASGS